MSNGDDVARKQNDLRCTLAKENSTGRIGTEMNVTPWVIPHHTNQTDTPRNGVTL
jgi:hypothetical protein